MDLDVKDRLALLNVLPEQGDFLTLKIVRELRESLSFSEDEHKEIDFETGETGLSWANNIVREFSFDRTATKVIEESLEKADKAKKLTMDHLPVYEKFMEKTE